MTMKWTTGGRRSTITTTYKKWEPTFSMGTKSHWIFINNSEMINPTCIIGLHHFRSCWWKIDGTSFPSKKLVPIFHERLLQGAFASYPTSTKEREDARLMSPSINTQAKTAIYYTVHTTAQQMKSQYYNRQQKYSQATRHKLVSCETLKPNKWWRQNRPHSTPKKCLILFPTQSVLADLSMSTLTWRAFRPNPMDLNSIRWKTLSVNPKKRPPPPLSSFHYSPAPPTETGDTAWPCHSDTYLHIVALCSLLKTQSAWSTLCHLSYVLEYYVESRHRIIILISRAT